MTDVRETAAPLSVAQEALWYQSVLFPQEIVYNETVSVRHDGPLDVGALRRALEEVVARHEIWRTTFDVRDGEPIQVVHPPPSFALPVLDLSALTPEQAEARAVAVIVEVSRVPYDVRRGPLLRARLMRFPGEHQRLYLAMHHIIFDGVSIYRTVVPELVALYDAFAAGRPSPLERPPMQYGEYARWEQERILQPRSQRHLQWWSEHLADAAELKLPFDRPRRTDPRFRGGVHAWEISARDTDRLRTIAQAHGSTLFQALCAVWTLLLQRWSGQDDVVFGTAADLRQRPELEAMVGYCLTPLVVRTRLDGDPTFAELIVRSRNAVLDGLDHLVPFERIVRELGRENDGGGNRIYQTMLVLEPPAGAADPRWSLHQMEAHVGDAMGSTKLDVELELDERPDGHLAGRLIYDSDLFDQQTMVRLVGHLERIIASVGADPDLAISEVALLTEEEARRQTVEWNATATVAQDGSQSVAELVAGKARQNPDAPALIVGEQTVTRAELQARADADAARLRGEGASPAALASVRALADELDIGPLDTIIVLDEMARRAPEAALWPALAAGARVVLASPGDAANGTEVSRLIRAHGATLMYADPGTWQALVDSGLRASRTLRALSGPGRLERELADEILARCRVLFHGHGCDGVGGLATLGLVRGTGAVTIGHPVADHRAYVLDRHDRAVPIGLIGELMLAGAGVGDAAGEDPFAGGPVARTGEKARWLADGRLELL